MGEKAEEAGRGRQERRGREKQREEGRGRRKEEGWGEITERAGRLPGRVSSRPVTVPAACVSLESTGYEAEERLCGHSATWSTRGHLPTSLVQMKPCQRPEPLGALRNRSPSFTSVPERFPQPRA